jgi:predicted acylesterase/phospholipase RssA
MTDPNRPGFLGCLATSALVLMSCGGPATHQALHPTAAPARFWTNPSTKVCLVLSVAGPRGVAHLGAIEAVKSARGGVSCVIGTSFGAVAGSMYATAPTENVVERFHRFVDTYVEETRREKEDAATEGMLVLGVLGALTGGAGLVLGAGVGFGIGAQSVNEADRARFTAVLDRFYGQAQIERLPIPFATLYQARSDFGYRMQSAGSGDVAWAVTASAANPFMFQDVDVRTATTIDPGSDRVAAVPVEEACRLHPDAALLVVNLTDQPALFSSAMHCPTLEVRVPVPQGTAKTMMRGPEFDSYMLAGFNETLRVLARNP